MVSLRFRQQVTLHSRKNISMTFQSRMQEKLLPLVEIPHFQYKVNVNI